MYQKIKYNFGTGGGSETSILYSKSWEKGGSESKTCTVGTSSRVTVTLKPGEKVKVELSASRGVMKIDVHELQCSIERRYS